MRHLRKCHFCSERAILNYDGECEPCEKKREKREARKIARLLKKPKTEDFT